MSEAERIKTAVITQSEAIHALAVCWQLVAAALDYQQFDRADLNELLEHLQEGRDYIVDELGFEFIGERLRVRFLDDKAFCSPKLLLDQLRDVLQSVTY